MPDEDDIQVKVIASEQRECPPCRQQTTWNKFEYRRWLGLRKTQYWACARCGKQASETQ